MPDSSKDRTQKKDIQVAQLSIHLREQDGENEREKTRKKIVLTKKKKVMVGEERQ